MFDGQDIHILVPFVEHEVTVPGTNEETPYDPENDAEYEHLTKLMAERSGHASEQSRQQDPNFGR